MSDIALLHWQWQVAAPLHTGYDQNLAEFTGRRAYGSRTSINLETHSDPHTLEPAFLASSVKGVFRAASAWLLERTACQLGADRYVTRDFNEALEKKWEGQLARKGPARLGPLDRAFGGSAGADGGSGSALRLKSPVSFTFSNYDDAYHAEAEFSPEYLFTWQTLLNKGKPLQIEQLTAKGGVSLVVRLEPVEAAHVALLWLAGDLISSGAFRFGRFTTRGYGVVHLRPAVFAIINLADRLDGQKPRGLRAAATGYETARAILAQDPLLVLKNYVKPYV